jgi:hypothetical protein
MMLMKWGLEPVATPEVQASVVKKQLMKMTTLQYLQ